MSASGVIGTFQGIRSPGTAYVLLHHYMGEIDGVLRAWGIPRGGTGAISNSIADAARSLGAEIRTEAPVAQLLTRGDEVTGVILESGEEVTGRVTLSSLDPRQTFDRLTPAGRARLVVPRGGRALPVPRFEREGEPGAGRAARVHLPPRRRRPPSRRDQLQSRASTTWSGPTTTRSRTVQPEAVHRHGHPDAGRSLDGAAGQARHELLRPVRALPPGRRRRVGRRAPRRVRPDGRRHHRRAGAEHPRPDPRRAGTHASRHRGAVRALRGEHLPGRALARAAVLQPAGARVGALPDAAAEPLDVRLGDAPRRRDHGRVRKARRSPGPPFASRRKAA